MKLDLFAHNTMSAALMSREEVAGFASEEEESFIALILNALVMPNILF